MAENEQETAESPENESGTDASAASGPAETGDTGGKSDHVSVENLRVLENIEVNLTVVVGGTELKIRDLLRLNEGSGIELDRLAGDPLDILANGTVIAKGEVVMVGERFGIRFSEIVDPEKRVESI